ncbi:hypothetical protein [Rufibacter roseus]|uniref:Peptidylprolyl isomerase n=1 Tax=Rufibacter roseus TaxID=1567108 RepID=A0ABW2DGC6_9BACT|nr:hypothetical protein [Rufibacter roseus]
MKNFTLALVLTLSMVGAAFAHSVPATKENNLVVNRQLIKVLSLSEGQYIKLKGLEKMKKQEVEEAHIVAKGIELELLLEQINTRFEEGFLNLLKPAQQTVYLSLQNEISKSNTLVLK